MWNKALNQVRVKASFAFKRAESVYYPFAICVSSSFDLKADTASKEAEAPHTMEFVLATLPVPTKEDLKDKGPTSLTIAPAQPNKTLAKDKLVIKMKP